ncbi:uncharacterized protein LOC126795698 [Argentina anserina]|uniref:uncharacterized protein LOC126795698 n=1 Tax=Argentina anserina TaxID=57926 RepID=UPI0021768C18|nr:uncharacterized protein LOC126795698 [Potentilla anserina]
MKMKQMEQESAKCCVKRKQMSSSPSPPPPPPPFARFLAKKSVVESVTKREIARFWRQKRINEEEHLLAAIKAAARIRARKLSEEDYRSFEESLNDDDNDGKDSDAAFKENENNAEIRVGVKDWWTKSKYAYLNQPDMDSKEPPKRRSSTFVPNCFSYKPTPLYPTSLGVF